MYLTYISLGLHTILDADSDQWLEFTQALHLQQAHNIKTFMHVPQFHHEPHTTILV